MKFSNIVYETMPFYAEKMLGPFALQKGCTIFLKKNKSSFDLMLHRLLNESLTNDPCLEQLGPGVQTIFWESGKCYCMKKLSYILSNLNVIYFRYKAGGNCSRTEAGM